MRQVNEFKVKKELIRLVESRRVYVAGGAVRDWLVGKAPFDFDLVLPSDSMSVAAEFANKTGGTLVPLDESDGVSRVVVGKFIVDFSRFRGNASCIEEDLAKRDFTINAMAIPLADAIFMLNTTVTPNQLSKNDAAASKIIDPFNGFNDLFNKKIRLVSDSAIVDDPLRILRAFRFEALLNFVITTDTLDKIRNFAALSASPAPERINHELDLIMNSPNAGLAFHNMKTAGVLFVIFPESVEMDGVQQPGFHHLDVLGHSLAALKAMDLLIVDPGLKFRHPEPYFKWIENNPNRISALKWAAFAHDFGKPRRRGMKGDRVTFYNHDEAGAEMVKSLGKRLRWSINNREFTVKLVKMHMRPFNLLTPFSAGRLTKRAMTRLLKKIGNDYPALFLLSMADSMAGCGPLKPADLDERLDNLGNGIDEYFVKNFVPVISAPRLLNGHDLMERFDLKPGPLLGRLLEMVEDGVLAGEIKSRSEAEVCVGRWLKEII